MTPSLTLHVCILYEEEQFKLDPHKREELLPALLGHGAGEGTSHQEDGLLRVQGRAPQHLDLSQCNQSIIKKGCGTVLCGSNKFKHVN